MEIALKYLPNFDSIPVERRPEIWLNYVRKRSGNLSHRLFHTPADICFPLFFEKENYFPLFPHHLRVDWRNGKVAPLQIQAARCVHRRLYVNYGRYYPGGKDKKEPYHYHFGKFKTEKRRKRKTPDLITVDVFKDVFPVIAFEDDPEFVSELEHISYTYHDFWDNDSSYRYVYVNSPLKRKDNQLTQHINTNIFPYQITDPQTQHTHYIRENHCLTCSYGKPSPVIKCPERAGFVWRENLVWRFLPEHLNQLIFNKLLCGSHKNRWGLFQGDKSASAQVPELAFAQTRNSCILKLSGLGARQLMWLPYRFARTGPTLAIQCAAVIVQGKYQCFLEGPKFSLTPRQVLDGKKGKTTPRYSFLQFRTDLHKDREIPPGVCRFVLDVFYRFYVLAWVKHLKVIGTGSRPRVAFDPENVHEEEHNFNRHIKDKEGVSYITFLPDDILFHTPSPQTTWSKHQEKVLERLERTTKQGKVIRWYPTWHQRFDIVYVQFKSHEVLFQ